MQCRHCESVIPDDSRFCGSCGARTGSEVDGPLNSTLPSELIERAFAARPSVQLGASHSAAGASTSDPVSGGRYLPGTVIAGRYRVIGLLGRGGMGEVCRADDLKLGQPVALKFLPELLERDEHRLRRLLEEVRLTRQISHPNVCRVYDIAETEGRHFISMEYVDGEDLGSLLRRIGRLPRDKAIQIARQMCAGLAAAHDRGILHRDLKPANVMIDGQGQVRITDFGLAVMSDEVTPAEIRAGTPDYMSPEQITGRQVSTQSDIYALGHVLYQLFTGQPAFHADSLPELLRLQRESTPTSPSSVVEGLDHAVERVIMQCLEKDPRDRPGSALSVAAGLPGGDPLAAALAAGETPSPEMIAAAGPRGGLRPAVAMAFFCALVLGLPLVGMLQGESTLHGKVPMDKPAAVLQVEAREIVRSLGYDALPADSASWFEVNRPALDYFARKDASSSRWDPLTRPGQVALMFQYRQGDEPLVPMGFRGTVRFDNPPFQEPGNINLTLGLEGRLLFFQATPPYVDFSDEPEPELDWSVLFQAAGIDMQDFQPIPPRVHPPVHSDTQAAWEGVLPHRDSLPVRVEAAAFRGRPVFFETVTPYDPYWSAERQEATAATVADRVTRTAGIVLAVLIPFGAAFLAVRNARLARGDRRGAMRLAIFVAVSHALYWVTAGHHVPSLRGQLYMMIEALGFSLFLALLLWVLYMALEPYVRRLWPEALVSWTRLLAGRFRDPLVGRDVLIGLSLGVGIELFRHTCLLLPEWLGLMPTVPIPWGLSALKGGRWASGELFDVPLSGMASGFGYILMFLLLRVIFRKQWLAAIVFVLVMMGLFGLDFGVLGLAGFSVPRMAVGIVLGLIYSAFVLVLITRFGVAASVACFTVSALLISYPITLDPTAPYFATSLSVMLVAVALAVYAFSTSLAGQAIFHDAILQEQT